MSEDVTLADYVDDEEESAGDVPAVVQLALRMKALKADIDAREASLKEVQRAYDDVRKKLLPDAMAAAGVKNLKLADGGSVYVQTKTQASVKEGDRPAFYRWLEERGHGGLVQPYVHPGTVTAFVKEQREAGAELPPMVAVYEEPMAVLRSK